MSISALANQGPGSIGRSRSNYHIEKPILCSLTTLDSRNTRTKHNRGALKDVRVISMIGYDVLLLLLLLLS